MGVVLIVYFMLSCFLTGVQFESQRVYYKENYHIILWTLLMILICPLIYIWDWIIEITKKQHSRMINWYCYLFKFNEVYTEKTIDYLREHYEPKAKGLDKILIKKVYKKFALLNKN